MRQYFSKRFKLKLAGLYCRTVVHMISVVGTVISKSFMKIVLGQRRVCNFRCGKSCQQWLDKGNSPATVPGSFILQRGDTPKRSPAQMTNGSGKTGRELERGVYYCYPKSAAGEQPTDNMQNSQFATPDGGVRRRRQQHRTTSQRQLFASCCCWFLPDSSVSLYHCPPLSSPLFNV